MNPIRTLAASLLLAGAMAVGGPARAQDADTKVDKALQKVEALLTALKAIPGVDQSVVKALEDIASDLRQAKDGGKGGGGAPPPPPAAPAFDENIYKFTFTTFVQGVDLKEDGRAVADAILREFVVDFALAKNHEDDKSKGVIRDHSEGRIAQSFPTREANHLKTNLGVIIQRWEWMGGKKGK